MPLTEDGSKDLVSWHGAGDLAEHGLAECARRLVTRLRPVRGSTVRDAC